MSDYTIRNLEQIENSAEKFGLGSGSMRASRAPSWDARRPA